MAGRADVPGVPFVRKATPREHPGRLATRLGAAVSAVALVASAALVAAPGTAAAGDSTGFYYGSDSNGPTATDGSVHGEPATGGLYGAYSGEIGTWTDWQGCTRGTAFDPVDVNAVNADEHVSGQIPGLSFYWFMAGPGADPHYDGTGAEAFAWGVAQAERVEADYVSLEAKGITTHTRYVPLMFMDIEGQPAPGYANGWNEIVDSCGRITATAVIPAAVDRQTFDGFYDYIRADTIFRPGVYSTPDFWDETFGTGAAGRIPETYEWTPETSTAASTPPPTGFRQGARSAQWFGGVSVSHEAGWQWTENGGDWDQFDTAHLP